MSRVWPGRDAEVGLRDELIEEAMDVRRTSAP
jgi:hypothetical protein